MNVIFSHGKESGPWGRKITALAACAKAAGFDVESVDYTSTQDPDERAALLDSLLLSQAQPPVLVGSSMGGYVSVVNAMKHKVHGLFLMAPALYMPGYRHQEYAIDCDCEIVHGWSDDVIPLSQAQMFAAVNKSMLHVVNGDHGLTDALPCIEGLFGLFLARMRER